MTQTNKYIYLTVGLLLITILLKAKNISTKMFSNFAPSIQLKLNLLNDSLINAGIPEEKRRFLISQILFETGKFTAKSNVAKLNNNFTGIKWINKPYQKARQGSNVPLSERKSPASNPLNFYALFDSYDDWAKDYKRILSTFGSKPIEATTLTDFVNRLAKNKYFDTSTPDKIKNYYNGLKYFFDKLN